MKRKRINRLWVLFLALLFAPGVLTVSARAEGTDSTANIYQTTGKYLAETVANPGVAQIGGEWTVLGLARAGYEVPEGYYAAYYRNVEAYVKANINDQERLHKNRSTDNSRVILALTAVGYDVTNVGGHNLLLGLADMKYLNRQGINGPIWALIAFDSGNYAIPTAPAGADPVTREKLIQGILDRRLADGGWNLSSAATTADPDMTAMALTALAPYYKTDAAVKDAVDKALQTLSAMQDADGGYTGSFDGAATPGSESSAQVIVALTALGIDPHTDVRFVKNGCSPVDALCGYYVTGGGFRHVADGERNGMATEQGYYALAAYDRFRNGKTGLYDMTDVEKAPAPAVPGENPTTGDGFSAALCIAGIVLGVTGMAAVPQNKKRF